VRIEGGGVEHDARFSTVKGGVDFRGMRFNEVPGFSVPYHVYRRP
jgi:hypothetical protein